MPQGEHAFASSPDDAALRRALQVETTCVTMLDSSASGHLVPRNLGVRFGGAVTAARRACTTRTDWAGESR